MKKIILIIIDGLGDEKIPQLGSQTPLEKAITPHLDFLASQGTCGLVESWHQKGKKPTSEDCHLALFGYPPQKSNPGRGVLEALGVGMEILANDVCLRGNFATINEKNFKIIDRRAGRIEKTERLIESINNLEIKGIRFLIAKAFSHRIVVLMRGKGLSAQISDGDPKRVGVRPYLIKPLSQTKSAIFTANVLNQFLRKAHFILKDHPQNKKRKLPANYILVRGAGKFRKIKSFSQRYNLRSAFIAGGTLYKGIARYLGMKEIKVRGANGLPNTNLRGKILALKKNLKNYDFIFCHIKAPDNLAEDGNFLGKKRFIEKFDKSLKPLLGLKNCLVVITGDHSTCSLLKSHCGFPSPILVWGKEKDGVERFSEKDCKKGALGRFKQIKLMPKIIEMAKN